MRVLIACECSGVVRDAFAAHGHIAMSCDLKPTERPGLHYQGDVTHLLDGWQPTIFESMCDPSGDGWCRLTDSDPAYCGCIVPTQDGIEYLERDGVLFGRPEDSPRWDMMIAHPPCTYLSSSGLHWNKRRAGRAAKTEKALTFVRLLLDAPIERIALENPIGCIGTRIRPYDQMIQPHQFGHDASKSTGLWLKNLPKLVPTKHVKPRIVTIKGKQYERWANQTDSGQSKLGPSFHRAATRAKTYTGIACAMAEQWSNLNQEPDP